MNRPVRILVCDDEELVRWALVEGLTSQGYDVVEAADGEQALERYRENHPALVLLDVRMPGVDGLTALRHLREAGSNTPVIILSALGDIGVAVEATRLGADRYMTKPFDLNDVYDAVEDALSRERLSARVDDSPTARRYAGLIGQAAAMQKIYATLDRLSGLETPTVLITGESGTGKDLVARSIHQVGRRSSGPFVEVDCTAIPETLMESTLFGHERGAFTDARAQHRGLFEVAQGGVVFLDEIGELPLPLQAKLLRVLENRTFKRVGGTNAIPFDAAIITATNRDLLGEVRNGRFREDLYYRLAVVQLELPPLRARAEDIAPLVEHFVQGFNRTFGRKVNRVSGAAIEKLMQWRWPGNVRELRNIVECAVIFNETETIDVDDLPPHIRYAKKVASATSDENPFVLPAEGVQLDQVERSLVRQALDRTDGNVTAAAKLLGLSRYALRNRAIKFGFMQGGEGDE